VKQQQSCPEDRFDLTAAIQRFRATILKSEFLRLCRMLRLVSSVFKSCKLSEQRKTRRAFRRPILAPARFERPKEDLLDASSKDGQRRSRSALRSCTPRNWHTLTQRERRCCESGTLRGPFVLRAHALVLAGEPLPPLRAVRICEATPALAVVAILMEPPELDLK
jgi:hypothetical protein